MITISLLPDDISGKLNVLDSDGIVKIVSEYRSSMTPIASISATTLDEAFLHTSGNGDFGADATVLGDLPRASRVGDILTLNNVDYVVLAFGFHKLCPARWDLGTIF